MMPRERSPRQPRGPPGRDLDAPVRAMRRAAPPQVEPPRCMRFRQSSTCFAQQERGRNMRPESKRSGSAHQARIAKKLRAQGRAEDDIQRRIESIPVRNGFTGTLKSAGVEHGVDYAGCTNVLYVPILGGTAAEVKRRRKLRPCDRFRRGRSAPWPSRTAASGSQSRCHESVQTSLTDRVLFAARSARTP